MDCLYDIRCPLYVYKRLGDAVLAVFSCQFNFLNQLSRISSTMILDIRK